LTIRILGGSAYLRCYFYVLGSEGCDFTTLEGTRTDLVVLRLDETDKTLELVLKQGQTEPQDGEIGIARLDVGGTSMTVTDIRRASVFKIPLASGGAKIAYGSYIGTGLYGASNPNILTPGIKPLLLAVGGICVPYGQTSATKWTSTYTDVSIILTWKDDSVSWYGNSSVDVAKNQLNLKGVTYNWVILGV